MKMNINDIIARTLPLIERFNEEQRKREDKEYEYMKGSAWNAR